MSFVHVGVATIQIDDESDNEILVPFLSSLLMTGKD